MRRNEMMLKRSEEGDGGEMKLGFDGKKQLIRFFIELIKSNDMYKTGEGKKRSNFISIAAPKRKKKQQSRNAFESLFASIFGWKNEIPKLD
jgi:hypothetical protein